MKSYLAKGCVWDTVWKSTRKWQSTWSTGRNHFKAEISWEESEKWARIPLRLLWLVQDCFLSRQKGSLFPNPHLESGWEKHFCFWKPHSLIRFVQHYDLLFSYKSAQVLLQWGLAAPWGTGRQEALWNEQDSGLTSKHTYIQPPPAWEQGRAASNSDHPSLLWYSRALSSWKSACRLGSGWRLGIITGSGTATDPLERLPMKKGGQGQPRSHPVGQGSVPDNKACGLAQAELWEARVGLSREAAFGSSSPAWDLTPADASPQPCLGHHPWVSSGHGNPQLHQYKVWV